MSTTIDKPIFNIPEPPSFLVKEGKVYKITELNCDVSKAFKSIDKWYLHKVNEAIQPFISQRSTVDQDDLEEQLAHINKHNDTSKVVVDNELLGYGIPLMVVANKVYKAMLIDYNPQVASISWSYLNNWVGSIDNMDTERKAKYTILSEIRTHRPDSYNSSDFIDIALKQDLVRFPVMCTYASHINRIVCFPRTFHTYNDGKLCTGDVSAKTFWEQEEFITNFNQINFTSLANEMFSWTMLLQDEYIVSWKIREDTLWVA